MQSLVTTVPQLHWEEEGEPEDTIDGMLGRALTYLVLYSTLGMFLRWSVGAQLLSSVDSEEASAENQEEEQGFGEREVDGNQRGRIGEPSSSSSGNQSRSISSRGGSSSPSSSQDFRQEHSTQQVEEMEEGMGLIGETPVRRSSTSSITKSRANLLRNKSSASTTPTLSIRRSTEDGGTIGKLIDLEDDQAEGSKKKNRSRTGPPSWTKSFPNNVDDDDEEEDGELRGGRNQVDEEWGENQDEQSERVDRLRSDSSFFKRLYQRIKRIFNVLIVKPINAVMSFMTAPLYAAVLSLIVALIPPLQKGVDSIEPLVGALQTAGACSIPLTMVVLGAYFHEEKPPKEAEENKIVTKGSNGNVITTDLNRITEEPSNLSEEDRSRNQTQNQNEHGNIEIRVDDPWRRSSIDSSPSDTSLSSNTLTNSKSTPKRKSWMRNPWASNSNSNIGSEAGDLTDRENSPDLGGEEDTLLNSRHDLASSNSNLNSNQSQSKSKKKKGEKVLTPKQLKSKLENRTILISILSRMFLTPLILIPPLAWYAISTKSNVVDDPVFVCCAVLLIGSPPALTLAQITSQASKSGGGFERLISRTICE